MSVDDAGTLTISVQSATTGSNLGQGEWYGQCSVIKILLPESVKRMIQKTKGIDSNWYLLIVNCTLENVGVHFPGCSLFLGKQMLTIGFC